MKNIVFVSAALLLTGISCSKTTEGNKSIVEQESETTTEVAEPTQTDSVTTVQPSSGDAKTGEYTERYVAEDGSSALVTFKNIDKENTISVRSNNKTIAAPRKLESGPGVYGNFDFEIISRNDSVIITQGNNIIKLKKARGQ